MSGQEVEKEEISMCVEVVYAEKRILGNIKEEAYQAKDYLPTDFKDLLKKEIDSIAQKHNFDNIISIKFTG